MLSEENYRELHERALHGITAVIRDCKDPMKKFKKEIYTGLFDEFHTSQTETYEAIGVIYENCEEPHSWLTELADHLVSDAKADLDNCKNKSARTRRQMDLNLAVCVYLVPSVLKHQASYSDALAECILDTWNRRLDTSVGRATYEEIVSGFRSKLCYITTAVCENLQKGPDCYELTLLKQFRDEYLEPTEDGHALVEEYYNIAPTIVKRMDREADRDSLYRELYQEYLRPCIEMIEAQEYEACGEKYKEMVLNLKARYIS